MYNIRLNKPRKKYSLFLDSDVMDVLKEECKYIGASQSAVIEPTLRNKVAAMQKKRLNAIDNGIPIC